MGPTAASMNPPTQLHHRGDHSSYHRHPSSNEALAERKLANDPTAISTAVIRDETFCGRCLADARPLSRPWAFSPRACPVGVEVADIFRHRGPTWRASHAGHVSLGQLKVMSAIERCRTAALGGHVERCEACAHLRISYNSCSNRHCPKCQAAAAKQWLADRQAELLPVPYFHVVFTLPGPVADIAFQNKTVVYDLLLKTAAETLITIAADPKHLGARVGITSVLHSWGWAMTQNPHS
jgi:hypothetical protein